MSRVEDTYAKTPFAASYQERRNAYIAHCLKNPGNDSLKGFFYEIIRIAQNHGPVHLGLLEVALEYINHRKDCADFVLTGVMRIVLQFSNSPLIPAGFYERAEQTILQFKYWPDEPGIDSMCYWTENHHILFSVNEYLAGAMFSEKIFTNSNMKGAAKRERARKRILKWLELRFYTGFNEWLSNVYFDEDMAALLNLIDFADDAQLVAQAQIVLDLMLFSMAVNSYYGQFVATHGRTYTKEKQNALVEATIDTQKLLFGMGKFANEDNMAAPVFAVSEKYQLPGILQDIACDYNRAELENRQRVSISLRDAKRYGLNFQDPESGLVFLSFEAYAHPWTINQMVKMLDSFHWWQNHFFDEFRPFKRALQWGRYVGLTRLLAFLFRKDITRNFRPENNIYTYRTPDYLLSTSQDFRKGYGGDQHHIWQATLAPKAVCFTTHPGGYTDSSPEGYWLGSGFLPRGAQCRNVAIFVYNIPRHGGILLSKVLDFTHAWFPQAEFDEVVEESGWIFARKEDGYLGLYSQNPYHWNPEDGDALTDVIVPGRKNIWIVEMGRKAVDGSFFHFYQRLLAAEKCFAGLRVEYRSPSLGLIKFGWKGHFERNHQVIKLEGYPRYENPYCRTAMMAEEVVITFKETSLRLNLQKGIREVE